MQTSIRLSLIPDIDWQGEGSELVLTSAPTAFRPRLQFTKVPAGCRAALEQIRTGETTLEACYPTVLMSDGASGIPTFNVLIGRLNQQAMLCHSLYCDEQRHARIRPSSGYYRYEKTAADDETKYKLSPFAFMQISEDGFVLSSPLGYAEVTLFDVQATTVVHKLTQPHDVADLSAQGIDPSYSRALLGLLANAKVLDTVEEGKTVSSADADVLDQWEFHDLLFHSRSRLGRHDGPYGGTFPFKDQYEELPMLPPQDPGTKTIDLHRPDEGELASRAATFNEVLERRESIREHGQEPITATQLGEFLFRTARIKRSVAQAGVSWRPSAAGGALHELEIYAIVSRCEGIDAGMYRYEPAAHQLLVVAPQTDVVKMLATMGGMTGNLKGAPQILLVMSARFQRIQYKYRSMAYALMLKNLGALYQTFYLVATEMNLAPCGLGGGHSEMFAQASGLEYLKESSIGEFMLGTRAQ